MEEGQAIGNPFTRSYPYRPNPSPFVKQPKAAPVKKRTVVMMCNSDKLSQLRKVSVGCYPPAFKHNWVGQVTFPTPKAAEATAQTPMAAIPTHQAYASYIFMQSATATVPSMPTKPSVSLSPGYCVTCTLHGKQCPTSYHMHLNPNWSDYKEEEEKTVKFQMKQRRKQDWNGDIQKWKELKELEHKNNNITIPQSSPKAQSKSTSDMDDTIVHISQLTDTLVTPDKEQKVDNLEDKSEDSTKDFGLEDTLDNIV